MGLHFADQCDQILRNFTEFQKSLCKIFDDLFVIGEMLVSLLYANLLHRWWTHFIVALLAKY